MKGGGFMPDCYETKRGCQLQCDRPLHREVGVKMTIFTVTYFLNDPILKSKFGTFCHFQCDFQHFS